MLGSAVASAQLPGAPATEQVYVGVPRDRGQRTAVSGSRAEWLMESKVSESRLKPPVRASVWKLSAGGNSEGQRHRTEASPESELSQAGTGHHLLSSGMRRTHQLLIFKTQMNKQMLY